MTNPHEWDVHLTVSITARDRTEAIRRANALVKLIESGRTYVIGIAKITPGDVVCLTDSVDPTSDEILESDRYGE